MRYDDGAGGDGQASSNKFDTTIKQEEIVNKGIQDLLFSRFLPDLPAQNTARLMQARKADYFHAPESESGCVNFSAY